MSTNTSHHASHHARHVTAPRRNNYFYGKLLDEDNLQTEQTYFNQKRRLLNRLALGHGVLCGLQVTPDGKYLAVSPGVAIDSRGREIVIPEKVRVDPSTIVVDRCTTRARRPEEKIVYLYLCYRECHADFQPALVSDCNPQQECAPSTIVESYCLEVSIVPPTADLHNDELCNALRDGKTVEEKRALVNAALIGPCAEASDDCVALATIHLDEGGNVVEQEFDAPQHVYSNPELFEMLLCLATRSDGGGPQTPPGPVEALTSISKLNWTHDGQVNWTDFLSKGLKVDFSAPVSERQQFDRGWFLVSLEISGGERAATTNVAMQLLQLMMMVIWPPGSTLVYRVEGADISLTSEVDAATNTLVYSAGFKPSPLIATLVLLMRVLFQDFKVLARVAIKCDFLIDEKGRPVDGNHFGQLDSNPPTARPNAILPTGDGTRGGEFESWFELVTPQEVHLPAGDQPLESGVGVRRSRTVKTDPMVAMFSNFGELAKFFKK